MGSTVRRTIAAESRAGGHDVTDARPDAVGDPRTEPARGDRLARADTTHARSPSVSRHAASTSSAAPSVDVDVPRSRLAADVAARRRVSGAAASTSTTVGDESTATMP